MCGGDTLSRKKNDKKNIHEFFPRSMVYIKKKSVSTYQ